MNTPVIEEPEPVIEESENEPKRGEVTRLLEDWSNGDKKARNQLLELVYGELQRMAHRQLLREHGGRPVHTGTLAHEVYLKLLKASDAPAQNRKEFFHIVARQMLEVLIDLARRRKAKLRGGNQVHVPLEDVTLVTPALDIDFFALKEALEALERFAPELSEAIELHYFVGLTNEEIAEIQGVSIHQVKRELPRAKAYLYREMTQTKGASDGSNPMEAN